LDVSASAGETTTTVNRLNPDGTTVPVRTNDGNPLPLSSGIGLLYDYEMPFGQLVSYTSVESPTTISASVSVTPSSAWLIHPGIPSLSVPIRIGEMSERKRPVQRAVLYPMSRLYAWTATDGQRKAAEYTLTLYTPDDVTRANFNALIDDAGVLLLNVPAGNAWGVGAEYVSVGDTVEQRPVKILAVSDRMFQLPIVVVDRPSGGSQSQRAWTDVVAAYGTWADVKTHYATWSSVNAGP
jgi:hypothetical protein